MTGTTSTKRLWIISLNTQPSNETAAFITRLQSEELRSRNGAAGRAGFTLALPADMALALSHRALLSQTPGESSQDTNKNSLISGPSHGKNPDKQKICPPESKVLPSPLFASKREKNLHYQ